MLHIGSLPDCSAAALCVPRVLGGAPRLTAHLLAVAAGGAVEQMWHVWLLGCRKLNQHSSAADQAHMRNMCELSFLAS